MNFPKASYDQLAKYAYDGSVPQGIVATHTTTNGAAVFGTPFPGYKNWYEFTPDSNWAGMKWLEANPYEVIKNGDGTYTFDTSKPNHAFYQSHPDALQKGLYMAGHLWTDMDKKYNTAAIMYDGWSHFAGDTVAKSFCTWMQENSDYGADITETEKVLDIFDTIKEKALYMIEEGVVTDKIPAEFSLVEKGTNTFEMTLGGKKLAAVADGNAAWNFGEKDGSGNYPYRVEYDKAGNSFNWFIYVPIEYAKPLTLSYTLAIAKGSAAGLHDANISAVLKYTGIGGTDNTYTFEIPKATYTGKVPITGDNSRVALWCALMVISGGMLVSTLVLGRKKGRNER